MSSDKVEKAPVAKKPVAKKPAAKKPVAKKPVKKTSVKKPVFHTRKEKTAMFVAKRRKENLKKKAAEAAGAEAKAMAVEKAATKGNTKVKKTIRTSASFHRPHTLRLARKPKFAKKSFYQTNSMDEFAVLKHPLTTPTAIKKIEDANTLVFICDTRANKKQIALAVQKLYEQKPEKVNVCLHRGSLSLFPSLLLPVVSCFAHLFSHQFFLCSLFFLSVVL